MDPIGTSPYLRDVQTSSRLLTLVSIVVVIAALYLGRPLLIPFALAVVFGFLLSPCVAAVEKCHVGRVPAVIGVLAMSFGLLAALSWGVTNQMLQVITHLPDYKANLQQKIELIRSPARNGLGKATATVTDLSKELSAVSDTAKNGKLSKNSAKEPIPVQVTAPPRSAAEYLRDVVGPFTGILETAFISIVLTVFILVKREDLRNRLLLLAGNGQLTVMTEAMDEAGQRLGRYLLWQFLINLGYGLCFGLCVYFVGVPHALLWGALASLLRYIPYLGPPAGAALPIIMALAVFPSWKQAALVFALFLVLEITTAHVVEPLLYGAHTGVSSIAILVAAIFWGALWGPVGLILSTPLTVCLILMGRYVPQLRFLEILLGAEPALPPPLHFYQRLLALDDQEARNVAENHLKEHPVADLYDSVVVPALALAEQDRQGGALDQVRARFIYQSTRDLIEELDEHPLNAPVGEPVEESNHKKRILCVAAREDTDAIASSMAAQLLRRNGYDAQDLGAGASSAIMAAVEESRAEAVYISALPPFAASHARALCRQLRQRYPKLRIVLGLWGFPGGVEKARERAASGCANTILTTLALIRSGMDDGMETSSPAAASLQELASMQK